MKHSVIAIQVLEEMLDNGFPLVCEIINFLDTVFPDTGRRVRGASSKVPKLRRMPVSAAPSTFVLTCLSR